ncbi:MAG: hypothetical protein M3Y09_19695, partial [Actinomycetota bacterium]|nr:hypothetical protein [Actinomycetota bacterium]
AILILPALAVAAPAHHTNRTPAPAATPFGFVGMNVDGPLLDAGINLTPVFARMESTGVEAVRTTFNWAAAQPVPGGPIDFTRTDALVGAAAARGMTVLPVIIYVPSWDAAPHDPGTLANPVDDAPYAAFSAALVHRYGPQGSYWSEHPGTRRLPIRRWQIWNEPNFNYYWRQPFAATYVRLLAAAHAAIHAADPGAKIVLAGFPDLAWKLLDTIYSVPGAARDFDIVAVHPYTEQPANVIRFLQYVRDSMKRHGDTRKPLLVTETGWNSSYGHRPADNFCCQTTASGQMAKVKAELPLLAARRRSMNLLGFYFYTWAGDEYAGAPSFNFAGLFDDVNGRLNAKPVYPLFRQGVLALERCRRKGATADRCAQRAR